MKKIILAMVLFVSFGFGVDSSKWHTYMGEWKIDSGMLKQTSTKDYYPLILKEDMKFSDVDVSVEFKPISGIIDASGGLVFRAVDSKNYYIVRANALEDNFRLYIFKNGIRSQIASATVNKPKFGTFNKIRVEAKGSNIKAYLNGKLLIEHSDNSFKDGYVGLWTKADSITEFKNFKAE
jgi:hypothetical protein